MIYEEPEEEDRESLPIEKKNRDRMGPNLAKDQNQPIEHLFTMKNAEKHVKGDNKIKLVLDPMEILKKKKAEIAAKKPPRDKRA